MFGFVDTDDLEKVTPVEMDKVIKHVDELKDLAIMSDEEKSKIRATWPRIENGKTVTPYDVSESEILVQKLRDTSNGRNIYYRINNLFGNELKR